MRSKLWQSTTGYVSIGLAVAIFLGCHRRESASEAMNETTVRAGEIDAATPATSLRPLAAEWMERIDLANGAVVYVAPPVGSAEARPVVVAIHGAIDDAGLICSAWRLIVDAYAFVVCPAGSKVRKDTYVWPSSEAIGPAIDRALVAVHEKFGERVLRGPALYVGFSQGANLAGGVLGRVNARTTTFARAVLTEGGYHAFDSATSARDFVAAGGERVLYTCSQPGCATWFDGSRRSLERAGASVRVAYAGAYGHSMVPQVRASIHDALPWVVEGLEGWETYATASKLGTH
jgi:hypothetical protein